MIPKRNTMIIKYIFYLMLNVSLKEDNATIKCKHEYLYKILLYDLTYLNIRIYLLLQTLF